MGFPWTGGYYNRMIRSMGPNPWWLPTAQGILQITHPPLQGVLNIQYADPTSGQLQEILSSKILIGTGTPGRVMPTYGAVWPLARPQIDSVQVTFLSGYGLTSPLSNGYGGPPSQTILVYGQPTGGTFTLTFQGLTTTPLVFNANASLIQAAFQSLGTVGTGNALCIGGPFPTAPVYIVWAGTLAATSYQPPITITPGFTGDPAATAYATTPPALPWSIKTGIQQVVADTYENREASQPVELFITETSRRMLMPETWGSYV